MNFIIKYIPILVIIYILSTTLIYLYLIEEGQDSQSSYFGRVQKLWRNNLKVSSEPSIGQIKCVVHPNVYTPKEIKNIYNYVEYKPCKPFANDKIILNDDQPSVTCINKKYKPKYSVDNSNIEIYGGSKKEKLRWKNQLPSLSDKQFVFVKCSYSAVYAYVFNRFSQKASDSANEIRMRLGNNDKKMSVLLLVLDSVSRYSLQRNLPRTNDFLKRLQDNKEFNQNFYVFEFEKSATPFAFTKYNTGPIIFGKSVKEIEEFVGSDIRLLEKNKDLFLKYQENAIWSHFSSLGYVTMFSHTAAHDHQAAITGRYITTDHVFTNFWRYTWGVIGISDIDDGKKCIGNKNMHDFQLDYTYQYFSNYPNNNKFAYVHNNAAHENTGNVRLLDADLLKFLIKYLRLIKSRNENVAIFLLSDHGHKRLKRSSQWDPRTFFEFHTPFTYLIATKDVISTFKAYENLKHNEVQLVSRQDINLSLKHLAYFPYNVSLESWYPQAKDYYTHKNTVSLFEEKISIDRTCADIGVDREYCLCSWYEPVEENEVEKMIQKEMVKLVSQYLNNTGKISENCRVDERIEDVKTLSFRLRKIQSGFDTLYKFELKTKNQKEVTADFNFCLEQKIKKTKQILPYLDHPYSFFKFSNYTAFLQLKKITIPSGCESNFCKC